MCTEIMEYDKENKQRDYQYMARSIETGELVIGYIVIDQPWCSPKNMWKYYIVANEYGSGGFCGGATDLGLKKTLVDGNTVEPFNQIAKIKYTQELNWTTELYVGDDIVIATINADDEIPYELWNK